MLKEKKMNNFFLKQYIKLVELIPFFDNPAITEQWIIMVLLSIDFFIIDFF